MREGGGEAMEVQVRRCGASRVSDETLICIFSYLDSPADRRSVSQVCRQWMRVDGNTRKHVQVANCYSVAPTTLSTRFPNLQSLKMKGMSRALEFGLILPNSGYTAKPWMEEMTVAYRQKFQSLWLQRMLVTDADLSLLAQSFPDSLLTLKLVKCSGFSAVGLAHVASSCRSLTVLVIEECIMEECDRAGEWLHILAQHNSLLEELNVQYTTDLGDINVTDLETIVENCKSLRSLKVTDVDMLDMGRVVSRTSTITELGPGSFIETGDAPTKINFPRSIVSLSALHNLSDFAWPMLSSLLPNLKKLDLKYVLLTEDGHCQILTKCVNLEVLEARNGMGDAGLITVANTCKNLRRIQVYDFEEEGYLSPTGIIPLAQNCVKLEFLVMYVDDLNNATLAAIADHCTVLKDCRFVLLSTLPEITDLPLDEGVKSLLTGCLRLTRFALYVRHGALTDIGMAYIGEYGGRLKWMLLGCTGESDAGLCHLAAGCQSLERLEMRDCPFSEAGLATAVVTLSNLKFLWVDGSHVSLAGGRHMARSRPFWTVEVHAESSQYTGRVTAYQSALGPRTDGLPEIHVFSSVDDQPPHQNGIL